MMVMKATTPPTMPMMTESMLVRPLDCLGWALGTRLGRLVVGRLVVGSQMMSSAQPKQSSGLTNMDSVIIGIVGGVVAFITIIIIIICIVRLRLADNQYRGGPLAGPLALRAQGKCTCLKPMPPVAPMTPTIYGNHGFISYPSTPVPPPNPPLALTWNGTVTSQKMLQGPASVHGSHFGTVGANSYMSAGQRSAVS